MVLSNSRYSFGGAFDSCRALRYLQYPDLSEAWRYRDSCCHHRHRRSQFGREYISPLGVILALEAGGHERIELITAVNDLSLLSVDEALSTHLWLTDACPRNEERRIDRETTLCFI
jgi:hypothetical protein